MTTETAPASTSTAPTQAAPIVPPVVPPPDGTVADLTARLAEANARAGTFAQQVAALTTERDTLKATAEKLEPRAKLASELEVKVQTFVNQAREAALVEKVREKFPGAEALTVRGVLTTLHEQGKINRFAEDPVAELAKVAPIISTEAQSLTRPPTAGGGSASAPQVTPKPAMSLFR